MPGMLSLMEGSVGVDGGGIGPGRMLEGEGSCVGVLDVPRETIWVSRRDSECRIRAISAVGSTALAKKANLL